MVPLKRGVQNTYSLDKMITLCQTLEHGFCDVFLVACGILDFYRSLIEQFLNNLLK